jgi:integrase
MGKGFKKASAKTVRIHRADNGPRLYLAEQIWSLIDKARPNMRAMILLAINGGLGPGDLATLTIAQCDGTKEWLDHPRPKTGVDRKIPLWRETREAIREAIEHRRQPSDPANNHLLFIGRRGESYLERVFKFSLRGPSGVT